MLGMAEEARRRLLAAYAQAGPADRPGLAMELASVTSCFGGADEVARWADVARGSDVPELAGAAEAIGALGTLWLGDAQAACAERDRAAELLRGLDDAALGQRPDALLHLALTEYLTERFPAAAATAERALAFARRTGRGHLLITLSCVAAAAHAELLDLDRAWAASENASEGASLQDVTHFRELVLWARVSIRELRGDGSEAERLVAEWTALAPQLQETLATGTRELRRLGARVKPAPARGELSERERDVADLVVQGRSNKQIAAALYVSEKTVEGALTRVYTKLGVRSRVGCTRRLVTSRAG